MNQDHDELLVEHLLRACAITPVLKGFYPLRDLILMYNRGEIPAGQEKKMAVAVLLPRYGKNYRGAMCVALRRSWNKPECRLTEFMGVKRLPAPPDVDAFARAVSRQMKNSV